MLKHLHLRNFKALKEFAIEFTPLTILAGPNSAGKSSVVQAIEMLGALTRTKIDDFLLDKQWEYEDLPTGHDTSKQLQWIADVDLLIGARPVSLRWEVNVQMLRGGVRVSRETVAVLRGEESDIILKRVGQQADVTPLKKRTPIVLRLAERQMSFLSSLYDEDQEGDLGLAHRVPELLALRKWAEGIRSYYLLNPRALRASSRRERSLGEEGTGLPTVWESIGTAERKRLEKELTRHFPRFISAATKKEKDQRTSLHVKERHGTAEIELNSKQVSDGLLRFLAALLIGGQKRPPTCALLEEPENGLHPRLMHGVVRGLRSLTADGRGVQVIATSHSPILLNYAEPAEVQLITRPLGKRPKATPLIRSKMYKNAPSGFAPGEIWYNFGEDELVGSH